MSSEVLEVRFDFTNSARGKLPILIDPRTVVKSLLGKNIKFIRFLGLTDNIDDVLRSGSVGAHIPVEDDAEFFVNHYLELEDFHKTSAKNGSFYLFMGDGAIEINSSFDDALVSVMIVSRPRLAAKDKSVSTFEISAISYIQGWRNAIQDMCNQING